MAELSTLARPYARAAFEYASDKGELEGWLTQLQLAAALAAEPRVVALLGDPSLTTAQQAEQFLGLLGDEAAGPVRNYLRVLAGNRRLPLLPQVCRQFADLKAERERVVEVQVHSAFDLPEDVRDRIAAALGKRLEREVVVTSETDPALLGGVLIRAGDTVIDGSVRGRLNKLAEALTH
ncbi:MAG TPA: F0F1 ATP synthase subunit delta [Pseudohaliea sp.]|nr:F0F1 ATP synthase subunit delta [Pseudohaliea sp.]